MQSRVDGSSTPRSSRSAYLMGDDRALIEALELYLGESGWVAEAVTELPASLSDSPRTSPDVCFVQGRLDELDTIDRLVAIASLKTAPRVVLCLDELDADMERFAKEELDVRMILVRPCGFAEIASALEEAGRSQSGTVRAESAKIMDTAIGGGR